MNASLPRTDAPFDLGAEIEKETRARHFDESVGTLSGPEAALVDPHTVAIGNAYERALVKAQVARAEIMACIPSHFYTHQLIDAYVIASRALWLAAQCVCDTEDLPDDGVREGITWQVPLSTADSPAQAGARIADDAHCLTCGTRGHQLMCPACQREANGGGR